MTIAITRTDLDACGPRAAAGRSKDVAAIRRMLALALVLEGATRTVGKLLARLNFSRVSVRARHPAQDVTAV